MRLSILLLRVLFFGLALSSLAACGEQKKADKKITEKLVISDTTELVEIVKLIKMPNDLDVPEGMVWVSGGTFMQGAVAHDQMAMGHEKPAHQVIVDGFFMNIAEVTNAEYRKFVNKTGYVTIAERAIDWEEMKKQLPEGTPKPHDSILQPGSLTFKKTKSPVPNLYDFSQWWKWTIGANWKRPNGPRSSIKGKDDHPVVHIAYADALAYCEWVGKRLPTEAEWELAAHGKKKGKIFFWGDDSSLLRQQANTWEGEFPVNNTKVDGFERRAPVKSYLPNDNGLFDMAGNVWEWTSDWYNTGYYRSVASKKTIVNPKGAITPFNKQDPYAKEKVMKGGSFLCSATYCASYRVSARMATSLDSSLEHLGFRTVASVDMVRKNSY